MTAAPALRRVDFPREGNGWSHAYCRRQWSLADVGHLRYSQLAAFERALWALEDAHRFLDAAHQIAHADETRQVTAAQTAQCPCSYFCLCPAGNAAGWHHILRCTAVAGDANDSDVVPWV